LLAVFFSAAVLGFYVFGAVRELVLS
jgi:hypothetical protein